VLVGHALQAEDFVPLRDDLRGRILEDGFHCR
jgi:hypothetical protein